MTELETAQKRIAELEAELAAMRAVGEPVAEMVPFHTPSGKRVAIISRFQHLPIGTKLYTHPQPATQDAEQWTNAFEEARDMVLHGRGPLEDAGMDSDRTNAVLAVLDECFHFAFEPAAAITTQGDKT